MLLPTSFILRSFFFSGILLLGSLRLELRRISGDIRNNQVYWGKGDDGKGICVFDPDGIELIDDAESGYPPYIVFEFKFREDPKITQVTQHMKEEKVTVDTKTGGRTSHLETTLPVAQKSTKSDSTLALSAISRAKGMSFHSYYNLI